ncbi:MAG: Glutamate--tRNA ligase mitochondrial [Peltula sp. TS41687]|nr:MAG: Glutamate--tRNA ligase mitochondrial [Peltula sp. TS41687]
MRVGGPYGPYRQSERTGLYREHANRLLETGHAYRCFCSFERLQDLARQRQLDGLPGEYDRACCDMPREEADDRAHRGEKHVIRLKSPKVYPVLNDLVYDKVEDNRKNNEEASNSGVTYEDPVLLKSDGRPTYHLANVVDDHEMKITSVIRGSEWMGSTPKHLYLYQAFGWKPPAFAHVGLLQDKLGQKLSKRNLDVDISAYRRLGVFPGALVNFLVLLGWSHREESDVMTMEELIQRIDLRFTRGNTIVALEKLWFLQRVHAKLVIDRGGKEFEDLVDRVHGYVKTHLTDLERIDFLKGVDLRQYVERILRADIKNYTTPEEFIQRNWYFFAPMLNSYYSIRTREGKAIHTVAIGELLKVIAELRQLKPEAWKSSVIQNEIARLVAAAGEEGVEVGSGVSAERQTRERGKQKGKWNTAIHHYLRWALAEGSGGATVADMMEILGREECLSRLDRAANLASHSREGAR